MKRRQFRLVLEPAPEEVVRLTQLHRYAGDVAGRGRAPIGGVLAEYIAGLFPQKDPHQVLDGLLGKGDAGWSLGTAPGQGRTLIIQTTGSRPSMWCRIGCGQRAAFSGGLGCNL